jgi:type IV pilus assembly protein PilC
MVEKWYIILGIIIVLVTFVIRFKKTNVGKHFFGKISMKIPVLGDLTTKTASARMARTLSTLMAAGIPLIDAINIVSDTMTNIHFEEALLQAKDEVAMGAPLSECIERSGIFPPLVHQMIGVGEETGEIDKMMTKLAEYYEDEVETTTAKVMTLLEPMIIIFLALTVGVIILAVLMPMAEMYKALENL